MRISANFNFWFILVFCLSTPLMAQNAVDCDQLRDKITQLERMDMNAMSPSIRQIQHVPSARYFGHRQHAGKCGRHECRTPR